MHLLEQLKSKTLTTSNSGGGATIVAGCAK